MSIYDSKKKLSSPEHVEFEHFEESNSNIHNGMLLLAEAYHMNVSMNTYMRNFLIVMFIYLELSLDVQYRYNI